MFKTMDNICRTCLMYNVDHSFVESNLDEFQMIPIFNVPEQTKEENLKTIDLINNVVPQLKIKENDQLPKNICKKCHKTIVDIYNFQLECLKNEEKFSELLELGTISELFNNTKDPPEEVVSRKKINRFLIQNHTELLRVGEKIVEKLLCTEDKNKRNEIAINDHLHEKNLEESKLNNIENGKVKAKNKNLNKTLKRSYLKCSGKSNQHNTNELYSCGKCQRKLKSKLSLMKHHELHLQKDKEAKELKCKVCNLDFSEMATYKKHQQTHIYEKPFLCSECGKSFTSAGSLKQHSFRHLEQKLYPCSECPKSFPTNGDLLCHYEIHKAKPRIHVCEVCGRGFYKPFLLKQHQRYHNNERPFACEFCEKRFVTSEKQRRHMRTHTGEKPYRCKYCDRAFAQSNDCIKHLRQHLGDNVYQCELCPLRFPFAKELRVHFASHKGENDETRCQNLKARLEEEKHLQIKLN